MELIMQLICKNCRHCIKSKYWTDYENHQKALEYAMCWATAIQNLVTGEYVPEYHCSVARNSDRLCGADAKWFELNEPDEVYEQVPNQTEENV
jgi:hypothetical protein